MYDVGDEDDEEDGDGDEVGGDDAGQPFASAVRTIREHARLDRTDGCLEVLFLSLLASTEDDDDDDDDDGNVST